APVVARLVAGDDEVRPRCPDATLPVGRCDAARHPTLRDVGPDPVTAVRGCDRALDVVTASTHAEAVAPVASRLVAGCPADTGVPPGELESVSAVGQCAVAVGDEPAPAEREAIPCVAQGLAASDHVSLAGETEAVARILRRGDVRDARD